MIGPCAYMTCASAIGQSFRAAFRYRGGTRLFEVLLCPEHTRLCEQLREEHPTQLSRTEEGWVYPARWLDSMGFVA